MTASKKRHGHACSATSLVKPLEDIPRSLCDTVCSLCQRKFPSKGSLANHVNAIHTEGTFREEGFQCALCPRLFATEAKRTQHYTRDHCQNTTALVCPHCRSVFPGEPMLRLHMAQDHDVSPEQFPGPCPLCVARGDDLAPHMSTVLTFKGTVPLSILGIFQLQFSADSLPVGTLASQTFAHR